MTDTFITRENCFLIKCNEEIGKSKPNAGAQLLLNVVTIIKNDSPVCVCVKGEGESYRKNVPF
jgi:hypothetical protein